MKKLVVTLALSLAFLMAKSQTTVSIKDVVNHVGKEVTLCDSVYSARSLESLSLLNLGGKFPKEVITVVIFKADKAKFEKDPVALFENKRICVTGKVTLYKEKLQIVVNDPKQLKTN
jgi:DNA/RNA endonuclease YhcR with UshA esterase domain